MSQPTTLFRYQQDDREDRVEVRLREYGVIRPTPSGWWINDYGRRRWVKSTGKKRFAHPTKEEALVAFRARKTRQIGLLKMQLGRAEAALRAAQTPELSCQLLEPFYYSF